MKVNVTVDINVGEIWINDKGYKLKVLDIGVQSLWLEWENGNKDGWDLTKFIEYYRRHEGVAVPSEE